MQTAGSDYQAFQIHLHGISNCVEWINNQKLHDVATELAVFIGQRSNCVFPSTLITGAHFTCPPPPHPQHVTYRASIAPTGQLNRSMLEAVLREWPAIHKAILLQGELLSVDDTCPVIISSFHDEGCAHDEPVKITADMNVPLLISSVSAVAMTITASVVIAVLSIYVLKYRKVIKTYVFPNFHCLYTLK